MAEVVIDKNELLKYEEVVSKLQYTIKSISGKQGETITAIVNFLKEYLGSRKYPKEALDEQNFYFSKVQLKNIIELIKKTTSITAATIPSYVSSAVDKLQLDYFMFSEADRNAFKKALEQKLQEILEEISDGRESASNNFSNLESKEVSQLVKNNIYVPKLNLERISEFLNKNVFKNILSSVKSGRFSFDTIEKITLERTKKTSQFFKKIWNPTASDLKNPFRNFEYKTTRGLIYNIKDKVKESAKWTIGQVNKLFPVSIIAGLFKFGISFAKIAFSAVVTTINFIRKIVVGAFKIVYGVFKFAINTVKTVGTNIIKVLRKTMDKIVSSKTFKLTSKLLFGFFSTPIGAYILGFMVGKIYKQVKKLIDFSVGFFDKVKEKYEEIRIWVDKNIVEPYINPFLNWVDNRKEDANFTFNQIRNVFDDPNLNLNQKIVNSIKLFNMTDEDGKQLISATAINRKLLQFKDLVESIANFDYKRFLVVEGTSFLLGTLGAYAGAALGAAFPILGPLTPIVGALIFGAATDALGRYIGEMIMATSPYNSVEKEESPIDEYINRTFGNSKHIKRASMYERPSTSAHLGLLKRLGAAASTSIEFEKSPEIDELKGWGIQIKDHLASANGDRKKERDILRPFQHIDNLSYSKIYNEIKTAVDDMEKLLDENTSSKKRGFFTYDDAIRSGDVTKTSLALTPNGYATMTFTKGSAIGGFNPYWFKILRGIAILNALRKLEANQMDPFAFVKFVDELTTNIDVSAIAKKYFKDLSLKIWFDDAKDIYGDTDVSGEDLIFGSYFNGKSKDSKYEKIQEKYNIDKGSSTANYVGYFPLDNDWHVFSKRLMEDQDFGPLIRDNTIRYNRYSINGFSSLYDKIYENLYSSGYSGIENASEEEVGYRVLQQLGGNAEEFNKKPTEERTQILKELILSAIEDLASGSNQPIVGKILGSFDTALKSIDASDGVSQEALAKNLEAALNNQKDSEDDIFYMTLEKYKALLSSDNEFYRDKLTPAIIELIKNSNIKNKRAIFTVLGLPYPTDENPNAAAAAVGEMTDPSVQ